MDHLHRFSITNWQPQLRDLTLRCEFVHLPPAFVEWLSRDGASIPEFLQPQLSFAHDLDQMSSDDDDDFERMRQKYGAQSSDDDSDGDDECDSVDEVN